jgi:hypothetical protein
VRADKKSHLKADKKPPGRSHKRGVVGYSKKSALLEEAITQMNAGKYGRSSAALKELLALDPGNMEARRLFATLHLRLGSLIPARQAFDALITEAFERQDYWLAESLLREYLAAGPRCVPFLEKLGCLYQEKGDIDEAVAEYGKAIDILVEDPDPDNPEHPSQLYAKIRELAPASPVAIRLSSLFDAQTGTLLARPIPVVSEVESAGGGQASSEALLSDGVPPSLPGDQDQGEHSAAMPAESAVSTAGPSEYPGPSVALPDQAVMVPPDLFPAAPLAETDSPQASQVLDRGESLTQSSDAVRDESPARSVLQSTNETESPLTETTAPLEVTDLSTPGSSGVLTEPEVEVPEAGAKLESGSVDAGISAPMPWEEVQDSNIEIPAPPSDEETASIHLSDTAAFSAPPGGSVPAPEETTAAVQPEQTPQQEQSALSIDLLKSGGFSWESVFDRAWKFGSKTETAEPPSDSTPTVANPEASTLAGPAGPLSLTDDVPLSSGTARTHSAMPWDQVVDAPVTIPPAPAQDAPLQPSVLESNLPVSVESVTAAEVTSLASTLQPMPWDQVQENVVMIPPATPDEEMLAPTGQSETSEPAGSPIEEDLVEPSPSQSADSPVVSEPHFRLAAGPAHDAVPESAGRHIAALVEPERQDFERATPVELDLEFKLKIEDPAESAPAVVVTESGPAQAQPEERPPLPISPPSMMETVPSSESTEQEVLRGPVEEPVVPEPAAASSIMRSESPSPMAGVPEALDHEFKHLEEALDKTVCDQQAAPVSQDSLHETARSSTAAVLPVEEAPALSTNERATQDDSGPDAGPRTAEAPHSAHHGKPAVSTEAAEPKEEWIRTGESIKFIEPAAPSTVSPATLWRDTLGAGAPRHTTDHEVTRTSERPPEGWIRTGESIRFIEPEAPLDDAHLPPPGEAPDEPVRSTAAAAVDVLFSGSGRLTDTASRPLPVEPRRRSWIKSRLARLRIAIITFVWSCFSTTQAIVRSIVALIVLGFMTTVLLIGAVGLTWVIMEQPPSATYQNFTTAPERKLSESKRNGYLLLLGFDALGPDAIQAGYERKPDGKDAERVAGCLNGIGGTRGGHANASASVANGWFRDTDPVRHFASHDDTIKGWVTQRESDLARYKQWLKLPFEDWGYGQTVAPPCGSILFAHQLYIAEGFTQGAETGVDRLEADMEAWRAAIAQARTLPVKMMAVQAIQDDITVASGLLANAELDGKQLPRLTKMLRPLDAGERSIRWPMQSELVTAAKTFEAQVKAERGEDPPFYAAVASLLPLPKQRRLNEYAAYYDASAKASADGQFGSMPKRAQYVRFPADSLSGYLTNPIENIIGLEPLSEWDRYSALVLDAEAHLRLASLQAWLRRGPQDADLLGRIAKAGQHFYDPYTGLPMLVNLKKGALYSVGHDGKDQDADPHNDIVAAIPVGPWSTTKPTAPSSRGK